MSKTAVPFWRRWDWLRWRKSYIAYTPADERRAWVRYSCNLAGFCHPAEENGQANLPAIVRNISLGGMNLIMDHAFPSGMLLQVELTSHADQKPRTLWVRIIRVSPLGDGKWTLGCAFARPLDENDWQALRIQRLRPKVPDRRAWVRFHCDAQLVSYLADAAQPLGPFPFHVVNVSPGGIAGCVQSSFSTGDRLRLHVPGIERTTQELLAQVVHVHSATDEGLLMIGCVFERELADDELAHFFYTNVNQQTANGLLEARD